MKILLKLFAIASMGSYAAPAASLAQEAPLSRRMLEPDSGVEFAIDQRWIQLPNEGSLYDWTKNRDEGRLQIRFPMDIKPPSSAAKLLDADLHNAKAKPTWKKEFRKTVKVMAVPTLADGIGVLVSAVALQRGDREFLQRIFYLVTPEGSLVAVDCTLPKELVGGDDRCIAFVRSVKLMAKDERQRRRVEQALRIRLEDAADNQNVKCSTVLAENKEFRDFYPHAELKEIPRFELLASILSTTSPKNNYDVQIAPINGDDISQTLSQVNQTCTLSPEKTYFEAVKAAWPVKLGVLTRLNTKSEK
jgi:hypothetical protein